jgi:phosphatidylserine decarboxylase
MDKISKFRFRYLQYALALFFLFLFLDFEFLTFVSAMVVLYVLYSFRDPEIELLNTKEDAILSPVDGKVSSIEELEDSTYRYKVTIVANSFDKSIVRIPFKAKLESLKLVKGTRVSRKSPLFEKLNEHATLLFTNERGKSITITHRLQQSFAPLFFNLQIGETLPQTSRYGVALKSETCLYLQEDCTLAIQVGEDVQAGESLVGSYNRLLA